MLHNSNALNWPYHTNVIRIIIDGILALEQPLRMLAEWTEASRKRPVEGLSSPPAPAPAAIVELWCQLCLSSSLWLYYFAVQELLVLRMVFPNWF